MRCYVAKPHWVGGQAKDDKILMALLGGRGAARAAGGELRSGSGAAGAAGVGDGENKTMDDGEHGAGDDDDSDDNCTYARRDRKCSHSRRECPF